MAKNTIILKKYVDILNEFTTGEAIKPGSLVKVNSAGAVVKHDEEGGVAEKLFVKEDALQGKTIDNNIANGDKAQVYTFLPGEEVYAVLNASAEPVKGDLLTSDGAGGLQVADLSAGNYVIGRAMEAKVATHDGRIKVCIL